MRNTNRINAAKRSGFTRSFSKENIQFVEKEKRLKKGVDKRKRTWYDNKAVARSG